MFQFPYLVPYSTMTIILVLDFSQFSSLPIIFYFIFYSCVFFNSTFWEILFSLYITDLISQFVYAALFCYQCCFIFFNLLELFHSSWNISYFHFPLIATCSLCNSHHCFVKSSHLTLIPIFPLLTFNHISYESRLLPFFFFHAPPKFF